MNDLEQKLNDQGFSHEDIVLITDLVDERDGETARAQAAEFLHRVFLRVEKDSAAGCALRRALGFSGENSLERAAKDFCVKKQYLHTLHLDLEMKLGDLAFLSRAAREEQTANTKTQGRPGPFTKTADDR